LRDSQNGGTKKGRFTGKKPNAAERGVGGKQELEWGATNAQMKKSGEYVSIKKHTNNRNTRPNPVVSWEIDYIRNQLVDAILRGSFKTCNGQTKERFDSDIRRMRIETSNKKNQTPLNRGLQPGLTDY